MWLFSVFEAEFLSCVWWSLNAAPPSVIQLHLQNYNHPERKYSIWNAATLIFFCLSGFLSLSVTDFLFLMFHQPLWANQMYSFPCNPSSFINIASPSTCPFLLIYFLPSAALIPSSASNSSPNELGRWCCQCIYLRSVNFPKIVQWK